jgi:hypothetical protein
MNQQTKVIHVELKNPYQDKQHYYYGSKAAIYDELPEDVVGIKKESLWNVDLKKGEYHNKFCTIRMGTLGRTQANRGIKFKNPSELIEIIDGMNLPSYTLDELDNWANNMNKKESAKKELEE